jgi:purine-binding chemotaxis protein CheW
MSNALTTIDTSSTLPVEVTNAQQEFVTLRLGHQLFGISVLAVQDVMRYQQIAPVPLSSSVFEGLLNVRGRIVTAVNLRERLGLPGYADAKQIMMVVVDFQHDLFALMVDSVGDVLSLSMNRFEKVPSNIDSAWRSLAAGVFKLDEELLVILDVANVINLPSKVSA